MFDFLFGGGDDTTTASTSDFGAPAIPNAGSNVDPVGAQGTALPSIDTDGSSSFFPSTAGSDTSAISPSSVAQTAASLGVGNNNISFGAAGGSSPVPGVAQSPMATLQSLENGGTTTPSGLSATSYGGQSPIPTDPSQLIQPPPNNSDSLLSQAASALGLNNKDGSFDTGGLLKGLVGAGGLAYDAIKGSGNSSAEKAVKNEAANAGAQGTQLESYLANGTLPPGAQQYVNQQSAAQKASIMSKYAWMGMTGSTAEAQELANVDSQAQASMFQIATQLYNSGVNQTGASSQLYQTLMNAQNQDNTDIGNAIKNFAASLGGGTSSSQKYQLTPAAE